MDLGWSGNANGTQKQNIFESIILFTDWREEQITAWFGMAQATYYNAVIRDQANRIIARTHLTHPKHVPWSWQIFYKKLEIFELHQLQKPMANPQQPIVITKRKTKVNSRSIRLTESAQKRVHTIKVVWNSTTSITTQVNGSTTLEDLVYIVAKEADRMPKWETFSFNGRVLNSYSMTMSELGVCALKNTFECVRNAKSSISISEISDPYMRSFAPIIQGWKEPVLFVKTLTGKTIPIQAENATTVFDLRLLIHEQGQTKMHPGEKLIFHGIRLEDDRRLVDYNIQHLSSLHLDLRLKGGSTLGFGNVEGSLVAGEGVTASSENYWKAFGRGLNLKGNCDNRYCKSRMYSQKDMVICTIGYKRKPLVLTDATRFYCPACMKESSFKPSDFLISGARCEFRFKLAGKNEVRSKTLVSEPFPKYIELAEKQDKVEYDRIEILTTQLDKTPHDCILCGEQIGYFVDEFVYEACEHPYHRKCAKVFKNCPLCQAKIILETDIKTLLAILNL